MKTKSSFSSTHNRVLSVWVALLFASSSVLYAAITESNLNKTFPAKPGGQLVMEVDQGSIAIKTSERSEVTVEVKRKLRGAEGAKAQEIFAAHEVNFDADGDRVEVRAKFKTEPNRWFTRGKINLDVEYTVMLPKQFNLDLKTGSGSIACSDIEGTVKVHSSGGDLNFATVKGPFDGRTGSGSVTLSAASGEVIAKSSGGDIRLGQMGGAATADTGSGSVSVKSAKGKLSVHSSGGDLRLGVLEGETSASTGSGSIAVESAKTKLSVKSSGGDIRLRELNGETLADTGSGSILVEKAKGKLIVKSSGGDIRLGKLEEDTTAQTGSGSISVKSARGKLIVKSSGGDLRIDDAAGVVQAHTGSGSVSATFSAQPQEDCALTSSGGNIHVRLADNVAFDVEAKTSGGEVTSELPIANTVAGKGSHGELKGKLNDGGKTLLLKTGSGDITIRKL
jgi:hypothetical protein